MQNDKGTIVELLNNVYDSATNALRVNLSGGTSGGITDADNGLSLNGTTVELGGSLTHNTYIELVSNDLVVEDGKIYFIDTELTVQTEDGISLLMSDVFELRNSVVGVNFYDDSCFFYDGDYESEFSNDAGWVQETNPILLPLNTALKDNYPNPFNPTTTISFSLKEAGFVSINIFNMKGQLVKTLVNENLDAAYHNVVWNGKDNRNKTASSGIYFYKMRSSNYTSTKKMILMK